MRRKTQLMQFLWGKSFPTVVMWKIGEEALMGREPKTSQQPNDNVDFNGGMKEERVLESENGGLDLGKRWADMASDDTNESGLGQSIGENVGLKDDTVSNIELPNSGMGVDQCRVSLSTPMVRKKLRVDKKYGYLWEFQDQALTK
ncbi:hypothetical protein V6N12_021174 [Hibiscus sabdariffa]|uniref:Uncharacterized protein n=1 Tax=Hibiscus sabdariffa TaxID=183260 RepID=A0ABR1Z790_9ROSI